jgi:hypothetical protein
LAAKIKSVVAIKKSDTCGRSVDEIQESGYGTGFPVAWIIGDTCRRPPRVRSEYLELRKTFSEFFEVLERKSRKGVLFL